MPNPHQDFVKHLKRNLVNPRPDMLRTYRQIAREHALMKKTIANLVVRVRRLEGAPDSPPNSPPESSP